METNLAVLIDFENIAAGTDKEGLGRFDIDALMARVKDKGRILVARSYADWGRFARFKQSLLSNNVTMYELTSHGMQDKNRADIAMVVDCLELAFTRDYVETFVVVSGDSDFTPLVLKLRELRKRVIGIGTRRSTSRLLINACDEFIFYDSIVERKQTKPRRRVSTKAGGNKQVDKAIEFVVEVVEGLMRENPTPPLASIVKTAMLRRQPDFSESDLGFGSFTRFLEAARDAGAVTLEKDKKSGTYAVDTIDEPGDAPTPPVKSSGGSERKSTSSGGSPGPYDDPYFPDGVEDLVQSLYKQGVGPTAFPTRMAVLEQLVDVVTERAKRRQRATAPIVADQLKTRLRRTHPELSKEYLESMIKGLREADLLIHKDGRPIRRASASFNVDKTAEELNVALAEHYIKLLREDSQDVGNSKLLAALLFGDDDRARKVEEIVAWAVTPPPPPGEEPKVSADLDDLDAFLEVGDDKDSDAKNEAESSVESEAPAKAPAKRASRAKRPAKAKAEQAKPADASEDGTAKDTDADEPKPKRKAPRRKAPAKAKASEEPKGDSAPADDKGSSEPDAD